MNVHRIHLRGPWEVQPLARAVLNADGTVQWSEDVQPPFTVTMPADPAEYLGDFRGRVLVSRRFNRPTNLEPDERVWVCFPNTRAAGTARVDGIEIGRFQPSGRAAEFDLTGALKASNVLTVEIESTAKDVAPGIFGAVALEIRRAQLTQASGASHGPGAG
jgi:hypothetical protein